LKLTAKKTIGIIVDSAVINVIHDILLIAIFY